MKDLNLQIPDTVYQNLIEKSNSQGVSIEALCISILEKGFEFIDPSLYSSMGGGDIRNEIKRVFISNLPQGEKSRRVKLLESQITRRIR